MVTRFLTYPITQSFALPRQNLFSSSLPTYLGTAVETVTENGRLFAEAGGKMGEVVYANAADLAKLSASGLQEGFYVVGSGDTG